MIQSQLPAAIRENPFRVSRLNHSSDFRAEWDVDTLNADQSRWLLGEVQHLSGSMTPDPGQQIPIVLSQPGYGKTHLFGRLAYQLHEGAFFVFVGAVPDPKRILDHLRWTVVETLFRTEDDAPTVLERAMAELLHPSLVEHASLIAVDDPKRQELDEILRSPVFGTLNILGRSTSLSSYQKLAASMSTRMSNVRSSVIRAMVMALSPQKHLARQWLRGEKLSEDEGYDLGILDDSPNALDVFNAVAAILEYKKPLVICFDQIESILKDPEGAKQFGIGLMELLAGVPNQYLIVSCFVQAWLGEIRQYLPPALLRRTRELELNYPEPEHALALVKKRLKTWPGYDVKRGEYFPFDSARLESFARRKADAREINPAL